MAVGKASSSALWCTFTTVAIFILCQKEVNKDKKKNILLSNKKSAHLRLGSHDHVDGQNFKVIADFIYPGTRINTNNSVSLEILSPTDATLE